MSNPKIKIVVEGFGEMYAELYPEVAPITVKNFMELDLYPLFTDIHDTIEKM